MGHSRIATIVSAAVSRINTAYSLIGASVFSGLLSPEGSSHQFDLWAPTRKHSLRPSLSLQEISTLSKFDPEEGNLDNQIGTFSHAKPLCALQRGTAGPSFSKHKIPSPNTLSRKKCAQILLVLLCLMLFALLIHTAWVHFTGRTSHFYVIIDCGSTGTRAYVYECSINRRRRYKSLPISLRSLPKNFERKAAGRIGQAYQRMETEPVDKLVKNVSGLNAAIEPLIKWAEKQIPRKAHKSTSLFLYATAGVRRLPTSDADWLLDKAWLILEKSSFMCHRSWVKIITGTEEAYYGWIALNYHKGVLGANPRKPTFGALDLGGSSLQVTFETNEFVRDETSLNLNIGSLSHHLRAYSLTGYGLNDAFDKSVLHLLKKLSWTRELDMNNGKIEIKHPCLQHGYKEKYVCARCTSLNQEGSPVVGRNTDKGELGKSVKLLGAPHWEDCKSLAKATVNISEWSKVVGGVNCDVQQCALTRNSPRPRGQFNAMSGFFVVFKFFNLTLEASLDDVLEKGQDFCQRSWEVAKSSVTPQPFIDQYCFRAAYVVSLLRDGLHISDSQVIVGSGSVTWTLGVALLEAGQSFSSKLELGSYGIFYVKLDPAVLLGLVVASLVLLICALSCIANRIPRLSWLSYLPHSRQRATTNSVLNGSSPFHLQRWSPVSTREGRTKMTLSPTVASSQDTMFGMGYGSGDSSIQPNHSLNLPGGGFSHSYSSGSLGQIQIDNGTGSSWTPHRGMCLQSRRSQSREDLNSSLSETHITKV